MMGTMVTGMAQGIITGSTILIILPIILGDADTIMGGPIITALSTIMGVITGIITTIKIAFGV